MYSILYFYVDLNTSFIYKSHKNCFSNTFKKFFQRPSKSFFKHLQTALIFGNQWLILSTVISLKLL